MAEGAPKLHQSEKALNSKNVVYSRPLLTREQGPEAIANLGREFLHFYEKRGYERHPSVPISSKVDPTVRLIGSHISVLKPYLLNGTIPTPGYAIVQDCIRTQNLRTLFDDAYLPRWGSFFTSLGAVSPAERLSAVCKEASDFFTAGLQIQPEHIRVRVQSKDTDLVDASAQAFSEAALEVDTQPETYYRHQIGVEGVWGRNFNVALRNPGGEGFSDVGNIILLENEQKQLGVELALGSTTILKQLHAVEHVNDFYPVLGLPEADPRISRKLEDAIIVSLTLMREGLQPNASDNRGRILRTYMRSIAYLRHRAGVEAEQLQSTMEEFEKRQFSDGTSPLSKRLIEYVVAYEQDVSVPGAAKTPEDQTIAAAIAHR